MADSSHEMRARAVIKRKLSFIHRIAYALAAAINVGHASHWPILQERSFLIWWRPPLHSGGHGGPDRRVHPWAAHGWRLTTTGIALPPCLAAHQRRRKDLQGGVAFGSLLGRAVLYGAVSLVQRANDRGLWLPLVVARCSLFTITTDNNTSSATPTGPCPVLLCLSTLTVGTAFGPATCNPHEKVLYRPLQDRSPTTQFPMAEGTAITCHTFRI